MKATTNSVKLDRRTVLKATGASAAGLASLSGTAPDKMTLTQDADALAITSSLLVLGGATAGAGLAIAAYEVLGDEDPTGDTDSVLKDQIYNTATAVAEGRSRWVDEMQTQYVDAAQGRSPFADSAWSEIRAAAAKEIVTGGSESEAKAAAQKALKKTGRKAAWNIVQRWNTGILTLGPHAREQHNNNFQTLSTNSGSDLGNTEANTASDINIVSDYQSDDGQVWVGKVDLQLPGTSSTIDDIDTDAATLYGFVNGGSTGNLICPFDSSFNVFVPGTTNTSNQGIVCSHPNFSTVTVFDTPLWVDVATQLDNEYDQISSDLSTYVSNLKSALDQGVIDAADIYSPSDIVNNFAANDAQQRVAAELIGLGAAAPTDAGYEAEISHNDLSADRLWVDLYVQFDGSPIDIKPDMVISSADYDLAYVGYVSSATGNYVTEVLNGTSDLTIYQLAGAKDQDNLESDTNAESDGTIYIGSDPPDRIQNPGDYNGTDYIMVTDSNGNVTRYPMSDVTTNSDGDFVIDSGNTPYSDSVNISKIDLVPEVNYVNGSQHVDDPASVSSDDTTEILESQKSLVNTLENDTAGGGGSLFGDGGLLDGSIFGVPKTVAAAGGAAAAAYAAMQGGNGGTTTNTGGSNR